METNSLPVPVRLDHRDVAQTMRTLTMGRPRVTVRAPSKGNPSPVAAMARILPSGCDTTDPVAIAEADCDHPAFREFGCELRRCPFSEVPLTLGGSWKATFFFIRDPRRSDSTLKGWDRALRPTVWAVQNPKAMARACFAARFRCAFCWGPPKNGQLPFGFHLNQPQERYHQKKRPRYPLHRPNF